MKQMMFARTFPMTHPKAGQLTRFVEKIWSGLADRGLVMDGIDFGNMDLDFQAYYNGTPKWHTIRAGQRWKAADVFAPKVWSGKPYRSKTIQFAPPITVEKTWSILMTNKGHVFIDGRLFEKVETLAKNDGLSGDEFNEWFPATKHFEGQIICWNGKIDY